MPHDETTPPLDANHTYNSTAYSRERYAHPFFLPAPEAEREPFDGLLKITDWSQGQLGPIPPVRNEGRMSLSDVIGKDGSREIGALGEIRFHALGDTGVGHASAAQTVAEDMATDFKPGAGAINPAFLLHLGDVIYGNDKSSHYGERFYSPYRRYPGKIIAIPGNHDGETQSKQDEPSLDAF